MAGSGYTRQSVASIVPTAVVRAAPINAEFDKLRDAFTQSDTGTTGHRHDGSSDEGSYVPFIADLDKQNYLTVDQTNNRFGLFIEVSGSPVEQLRFQDGVIVPVTDNDIDLGTSSLEYKDVYVDGTAYIDTASIGDNDYTTITDNEYDVSSGDFTLDVDGDIIFDADGADIFLKDAGTTYATLTNNSGNLTLKSNTTTAVTFTDANADFAGTLDVTGATTLDSTLTVQDNAVFNANTTLGSDVLDTVTYNARVASNIVPSVDSTYTLGSSSLYWSHAYLDAITTTGNVSVGGALDVTGNTTLTGDLTVNGNTTIGDANTDTVAINAKVSTSLVPDTDSAYNLGSASAYWADSYLDSVTTTGNVSIGGNITVNGSADFTNTTLDNVTDPTTAQQAATKNYVDTAINNLIGGAPATLDTLNEIAEAINDDDNVYTTLTTSIATKLSLAGGTMTGAIAMGGNKITGAGTPTTGSDLTTKTYVDGILGSATAAADSVADAEKLAINPEDSQFTLSDSVTTGFSALHYAAKAEDSYNSTAQLAAVVGATVGDYGFINNSPTSTADYGAL